MAEFKQANDYTLKYEGGYANVPGDSGGETYCGISRNNWPAWEGWQLLSGYELQHGEKVDSVMVISAVNGFYFKNFWQKMRGNEIQDEAVACYIYDWYVNSGDNAIKAVQSVLSLPDDGVFGSDTLAHVNNYEGDLLTALYERRVSYYQHIASTHSGYAQFLKGWLSRATDLYEKLKTT